MSLSLYTHIYLFSRVYCLITNHISSYRLTTQINSSRKSLPALSKWRIQCLAFSTNQ